MYFLCCFQQELIQISDIKNVGFVSPSSPTLLLPGKRLAHHLKIQEGKLKENANNLERLCQPDSADTRLLGEIVGVVEGLLRMYESGVSSSPLCALKTNE